MDIKGLKLRILPAPVIIKNFVKDDPSCNYEHYLVELLNSSKWFAQNHEKKFVWVEKQSNGEPDAYSEGYGLDFKLMLAESRLQGISIFSTQYALLPDEKVSTLPCKKPNETREATRLHTALKSLKVDNLNAIRNLQSNRS